MIRDRLFDYYNILDEEDARRLSYGPPNQYTVEVHPPIDEDPAATLNSFVREIMEMQSNLFKLKNSSPVTAFEVRRPNPGELSFVFGVETKRLQRKVKNHLYEEVPGVRFSDGVSGLPVSEEDSVGGGVLTAGLQDYYPFNTDLDRPLMNNVAASLDEGVLKDSKFVLQILFQPAAGDRFRQWWWRKNAFRHANYLEGDSVGLVSGSRSSTSRERSQANAIYDKIGSVRFHASIRILVIGAEDNTRSRLMELSGAFNRVESDDTGQYLDTVTLKSWLNPVLVNFAEAVNMRRFMGRGFRFQLTPDELAALVSLPSIEQENINYR